MSTNASVSRCQRDLWRARDSKKEEVRKSMLLYMEAEKDKRHAHPSAPTAVSVGSNDCIEAPASAKPVASTNQQQQQTR